MKTTWTDLDLERFVDSDLPDATMSQLASDMRHDPSLRARVASIQSADDQVRSLLLGEPSAGNALSDEVHDASIFVIPPAWRGWAVAASAVLLASLAVLAFRRGPAPNPQLVNDDATRDDGVHLVQASDDDVVRVLWTFRVKPPEKDDEQSPDDATDAEPAQIDVPPEQVGSLARRDTTPEPRVDRMKSTSTLLSGLDASDRVALCATLVHDHRHRTAAFQELRALGESNREVRVQIREVTQGLRSDPTMQGWIKSYIDPVLAAS